MFSKILIYWYRANKNDLLWCNICLIFSATCLPNPRSNQGDYPNCFVIILSCDCFISQKPGDFIFLNN